MIEIKDYQENERFQHHFDVIRANAPVSYGGLKLYVMGWAYSYVFRKQLITLDLLNFISQNGV